MWKPIHNIYTEKTLLSEQRIFIMPLPLFKYTFECQTTKNLQACYCGLCNVVEYTQKGMGTKMIIYSLTIKFELQNFGKDPWEAENCTTTCTISFRGEHNFVWHSVVEGCKKECLISVKHQLSCEGRADGEVASAWGSSGPQLLLHVVMSRTGWNWCLPLILPGCTRSLPEMQRGAHHILPPWQRPRMKQGIQTLRAGQCQLCNRQIAFLDELIKGKHD